MGIFKTFFLNTKTQRFTKLDVDNLELKLSTSGFVNLCVFVFKKIGVQFLVTNSSRLKMALFTTTKAATSGSLYFLLLPSISNILFLSFLKF
jgi:hypothetical protein